MSPSEIRESLYTAALSAFRDRGFDAVTVSELTRVTGVAKGTFFNHFPTKDHILSEYLGEIWEEAEEEATREGLLGTDALVRVVESVGRALESDPGLARALAPRLPSLPPRPPSAEGENGEEPPEALPSLMDGIRARFLRRLRESLPFAVPLQRVSDEDLAGLLTGSLKESLREGTLDLEELGPLVPLLTRRAVFLIRSAGFAAPDPPRG